VVLIDRVSRQRCQLAVGDLKYLGSYLHLVAAVPANDVTMVALGQLVNQVPIRQVRSPGQPVCRKEVQGAIHGRLRQSRNRPSGTSVDFKRRKVAPGVAQDVEDRQSL
jgi:hypothetical protein